jgi:hypothetical protein
LYVLRCIESTLFDGLFCGLNCGGMAVVELNGCSEKGGVIGPQCGIQGVACGGPADGRLCAGPFAVGARRSDVVNAAGTHARIHFLLDAFDRAEAHTIIVAAGRANFRILWSFQHHAAEKERFCSKDGLFSDAKTGRDLIVRSCANYFPSAAEPLRRRLEIMASRIVL